MSAEKTERNWRIFVLVSQGHSYAEVGARWGISRQSVHAIVVRERQRAVESVTSKS